MRLCRLKFECRGYRVPALIELTFNKRQNNKKQMCDVSVGDKSMGGKNKAR